TLGPPDPRPQAFELNDLAVVHEQIDIRPVVLDVPGEHLRIGGLEHDLLQAQGVDELGHHVGTPGGDVLRAAFRFEHEEVSARVEAAAGLIDCPARIARTFGGQLGGGTGAAGAELDADFRLRLQSGSLHVFYQPDEVVRGHGDEAAGNFDDV